MSEAARTRQEQPERSRPTRPGIIANNASGTHAAMDPDPSRSGVLGAVRTDDPVVDPDQELIEAW